MEWVTQTFFTAPKSSFVASESGAPPFPDDVDIVDRLKLVLHALAKVHGPGCRVLDPNFFLVIGRVDLERLNVRFSQSAMHSNYLSVALDEKKRRHVAVTYGYY